MLIKKYIKNHFNLHNRSEPQKKKGATILFIEKGIEKIWSKNAFQIYGEFIQINRTN